MAKPATIDSHDDVQHLARQARHDLRIARGAFRALARRNGYEGTAGGWIAREGSFVTQGWQALASLVVAGRAPMLPDAPATCAACGDPTKRVRRIENRRQVGWDLIHRDAMTRAYDHRAIAWDRVHAAAVDAKTTGPAR